MKEAQPHQAHHRAIEANKPRRDDLRCGLLLLKRFGAQCFVPAGERGAEAAARVGGVAQTPAKFSGVVKPS